MGANKVDRIELEDIEFHKRVRAGYLDLARKEPGRIRVISASGGIEEIKGQIIEIVESAIVR
jgi:dTMP kinase